MTQAKRMLRAWALVGGTALSIGACAPGVVAPPLAGGSGGSASVTTGGADSSGTGSGSGTDSSANHNSGGSAPGVSTGGWAGVTDTGGSLPGSSETGTGGGGAPTIAPGTGGGASSSGGRVAIATGGAPAATGGRVGSGGAITATGGRPGSGGTTTATGGRPGSGGASGPGSTTTGGASGLPGTGGRSGGSGGAGVAGSGGGAPLADGGVSTDAGTAPVAAWRPFADSSPWNTPIGTNPPIDPSSSSLVDDLVHGLPGQDFTWINLADFSVPVYYVDGATPVRTVSVDLAGQGFDGKVPIPVGAVADGESDHHFCIVDRAAQLTWSMWDATISPTSAHCTVGARADLSGSGVHPLADVANPWQASVDARACGFPLIAGLIRVEEIRAGRIAHALVIAYPHIRSRYYVSPASTAQGTTDADAAQPTRGIPCGGRVQLDPNLDVTKLGLSRSAVIIARALQEFGAYVGDYSGSISLYAENAPEALAQWNTGLLDSNALESLDLTRLRVLTIGALHDNHN